MKKPPLAPKPKLPAAGKPSPPPIAPKPGVLAVTQPSPATLKRAKPAVAPKPCIPKSSASPPPPAAPPSPPRPGEALITSQEAEEALHHSLSLLNSRNGILSSKRESDYIIPTCSCRLEDCSQCHRLENGSVPEVGGEPLQNGISSSEGSAGTKAEEEGGSGGGLSRKPRDKPQRQRHLEKGSAKASETVQHQESAAAEPEPDVSEARNADVTDSQPVCDVAGSIVAPVPSLQPSQVERLRASLHTDLQVPAAPSKPLPIPQPRRLKKPALVRQDGVEGKPGTDGKPAGLDAEELKRDPYDPSLPQRHSYVGREEPDAPVPPPRQTSLSPRLHRPSQALNKHASHSLVLLSQPDKKAGEEQRPEEEDEEDGYGDFERYPITHSLPKQIKLGCQAGRRALSAEEQPSPRAPPRKPQRLSLPAPPPPSFCPPAPPHANTPMRELPAPPQEKSWRFARPCVTFFSRQMPTRSSMPPKARPPALGLGGKQRAQSFSAADLATRQDSSHKRSLSFRKLLELRLSVKMLPKLLAKGGHSLDCTSVETPRGERSLERPKSCIGAADICGEDGVEYENVPLYEEIPEYMNLPFHSARQSWAQDPDAADSDIYEVQDPYHSPQDHEYERYGPSHTPQVICIVFLLSSVHI